METLLNIVHMIDTFLLPAFWRISNAAHWYWYVNGGGGGGREGGWAFKFVFGFVVINLMKLFYLLLHDAN